MKKIQIGSFTFSTKNTFGNLFFTSLFYCIWLVFQLVNSQSFNLESFPNRMIGIATLEAYDVSLRVTLFYKSVFLFLISFLLLNLIGRYIHSKNESLLKSIEVKIINYVSLIGVLYFLFQVFEYKVFYSLELIYHAHKLMLLALVIRKFFFPKIRPSYTIYLCLFILSSSLYFFVADCFSILGAVNNPDFFITSFLIFILILLGFYLPFYNTDHNKQKQIFYPIAFALVPLAAFPLVSVLKDELYLVLKNNNLQVNHIGIIYTVLLLILLTVILYRFNRINKRQNSNEKNILATAYFPLFIFSIITYTFYSHFYYYSDEAFESGNKYLPIMEFELFNVIPTLEKFNSHLLSDYFFSSIYTFFNGMGSTNEMELYDFMYIPFSFTLFYYLIYFLTGNSIVSLFTILLFPFYTSLLPGGYSFAIPGLFAMHFILNAKQSFKNYFIVISSVLFITLWRFDLGYSCMVIIPTILIIYNFIDPFYSIKWKPLLLAFIIVLGLIAAFLSILSLYREVNLFEKSLYTLNYFSSAQTYGYSIIGWTNTSQFKMHYYVFPIAVLIIVTALFLNYKKLTISKQQRLSYLSLLFLCAFYFMNFNRGLIRHSLIEGGDEFTSSFIYIILPGSIFVFFRKQATLSKFIVFVLFSFFSILNFKMSLRQDSISLFEQNIHKIQTQKNDTLSNIKNRILGLSDSTKLKDYAFIQFIKNHTKADETFMDFTGNSMLYFYTKKISPSFFYQNPFCSHNEFLQKRFIQDFSNYSVPFLIFTNTQANDNFGMDGVPNIFRHYRMAEYFYKNYEPHVIVDKYRVWKKKGHFCDCKNELLVAHSFNNNDSTFSFNLKINPLKQYYILAKTKKDSLLNIKILHASDTFNTSLVKLNSTTNYYVLEKNWPEIKVILNGTNFNCEQLNIYEADYWPDFFSNCYYTFDLQKLPYVWGNFDDQIQAEPVLFKSTITGLLQKDTMYKFSIPNYLDKSSGNTLIVTCSNKSKFAQKMQLTFGDSSLSDKSIVSFKIEPESISKKYAIRVSSIYKWYNPLTNFFGLKTDSSNSIQLHKVQLSKGL